MENVQPLYLSPFRMVPLKHIRTCRSNLWVIDNYVLLAINSAMGVNCAGDIGLLWTIDAALNY